MSDKIYHGDEWRYEKTPAQTGRTRAAEQSHVNIEYCNGRMKLSEWRSRTDEMSEPTKWTAAGKIAA